MQAEYLKFTRDAGAPLEEVSWGEAQALSVSHKLSDAGRYKMRVLLAGSPASLLPAFLASAGHEVFLVDPFLVCQDFKRQMERKRRWGFHIIRNHFVSVPANGTIGQFRLVGMVDSIGGLCLRGGEPVVMATARAFKQEAGAIFFTAEVVEQPDAQSLSHRDGRRSFIEAEVRDLLLSGVDAVERHTVEPNGHRHAWLVR